MTTSRGARWGKRVGVVVLVLFALWLGAGAAAYVWLTDARLTALSADLVQKALPGQKVAIGAVHLSGWHSIVVKDVRIGSVSGKGEDLLRVAEMRLLWHWMPLLQRELVVPEMAVTGIVVNWEAAAAPTADANAPRPGAAQAAPAEPADTREHGFTPPDLPLRILVRQARVDVDRARVTTAAQEIALTALHLDASLDASAATLHALGTLQLGQRGGTPSVLTVRRGGKDVATVTQHLELALTAHDWLTGSVVLREDGQVQLPTEHVPKVPLHADADVHVDLGAGEVRVERCVFTAGSLLTLELAAKVLRVWTTPAMQLDRFQLEAHLTEMAPYVAKVVPNLRLAGEVHGAMVPGTVPLDGSMRDAPLEGTVTLHHVDASLPQVDVRDLHGALAVAHGGGALTATAALTVQSVAAAAAQSTVSGLRATGWMHFAIGEGILLPTTPLHLDVQVGIDKAQTPQAGAEGARWHLYGESPLAWWQGDTAAPLQVTSALAWQSVTAAQGQGRGGLLTCEAELGDRTGREVHAQFGLSIDRTVLPNPGAGPWHLPPLHFDMEVQRHGDTAILRRAQARLGTVVANAQGTVEHMSRATPHVTNLRLQIPAVPLRALVALAPPPGLALTTLTGTLQAEATVDGDVPYGQLAADATPPNLDAELDPSDARAWQAGLHAYANWARRWTHRFDGGFPFQLHTTVALSNVDCSTATASVTGMALQVHSGIGAHGPYFDTHVRVPEAPAPTPTPVRGVEGSIALTYGHGAVQTSTQLSVESAALANEPTPLEHIAFAMNGRYVVDGDARIDTFDLRIANRGLAIHGDGLVEKPLEALAMGAWMRPELSGMRAATHWTLDLVNKEKSLLTTTGLSLSGAIHLNTDVILAKGVFTCEGALHFDDFSLNAGEQSVEHVDGTLPAKLALRVGTSLNSVPIVRDLSWGGGVLSLVSDAADIRDRPARPVYYDRLRPYRLDRGVRAAHAQSGAYEMTDIALEGRVENGMLLADWIGMNILGGEVAGNFALQLGRDSSVRGDLTFKASNVDASYFPALHLQPGPASQLSADMRLGFSFGDNRRDTVANINVTRIGTSSVDRFLQILDPEGKSDSIQKNRRNLHFVGNITNLAVWVRYENLTINMSYEPLLRIPGTGIGYRPIPRELLPPFSISNNLDVLQPVINDYLGPTLGWHHAT